MRCTRCLFKAGTANVESLSWPAHPFPTPYEIFHIDQAASQSEIKRRYYELVKIYHPDKLPNPTPSENERFHKIVAANDLLCDRAKRSAFDMYGVGWQWTGQGRHPRVYAGQMPGSRFDRYNKNRRSDHQETTQWDNFYPGNRDQEGETRYTSNTNFFGFLVFLSTLGAVIQAARLGRASAEINERADKQHFITARDLAESRRLAKDLGKEERKRLFLAHRSGDATGYAFDEASRQDQRPELDGVD